MDIKVNNNVPSLNVTINQSEDGSFAILLAEDKRNELGCAELGSVKRIGDRDFIVLEHTELGTAVITKDIVRRMEFGSTGDYTASDVRSYCINDFYGEMAKAIGEDKIIRHTIDLTADDGTGANTVEDYVSVLTTERYRRYRKFLNAIGESWWTATRVTSDVYSYTGNVCYVNSNGILNWNDCNWSNGVRPFWWICEVYKLLRQLQGVHHIIKRVHTPSHQVRWDKYKRIIWKIFRN